MTQTVKRIEIESNLNNGRLLIPTYIRKAIDIQASDTVKVIVEEKQVIIQKLDQK